MLSLASDRLGQEMDFQLHRLGRSYPIELVSQLNTTNPFGVLVHCQWFLPNGRWFLDVALHLKQKSNGPPVRKQQTFGHVEADTTLWHVEARPLWQVAWVVFWATPVFAGKTLTINIAAAWLAHLAWFFSMQEHGMTKPSRLGATRHDEEDGPWSERLFGTVPGIRPGTPGKSKISTWV